MNVPVPVAALSVKVTACRALVLLILVSSGSGCSRGTVDPASEPTITRTAEGVEIVEYSELSRQPTWSLGDQPLLAIGVDAGEQPYMFTDIGDTVDGELVTTTPTNNLGDNPTVTVWGWP